MSAQPSLVNLIAQGARARGLDPAAVLAVASMEGLSGGIGDGGHAYGPFQLNNAGGVITNSHPGVYSQQIQSWANSPQGIAFALDRIAQNARGLRGRAAINAIVSQFERPANPTREIAGATAAYGRYGGLGQAPTQTSVTPNSITPGPSLPPPQASQPRPNLTALLNAGNSMFGLPALPSSLLESAPTRLPQAAPPAALSSAGGQPTSSLGTSPSIKGPTLRYIEHFAQPFGLTITSTTGGKHAPNSYHYRGRAVDFGGDPEKMAALAQYALKHANQFQEMFYTGPGHPGFFISGGKVYPLSQLDKSLYLEHENHVHLAR